MRFSPQKTVRFLQTASGIIEYPAHIPVTTFGDRYPLDALIQPYLPRLAPAVMVSFHYAQAMKKKPRLPVLIDSGGFAAFFERSEIIDCNGIGTLRVSSDNGVDEISPLRVLEFQEQHADVAFALDFPIPPGMERKEANRRMRLTIANAVWALNNRRRKGLPLFACIQGLDPEDYLASAVKLAAYPFEGYAIGGLVPRARDRVLIETIVRGVREVVEDRPLHVFGLGKPELMNHLFTIGVNSVDSSSYVKLAADGKSWSDSISLVEPAITDRLFLALQNLLETSRFRKNFGLQNLQFEIKGIRNS